MRRCFLHAGPPKTGSSSIQRFLCQNRDLLAEANFYVPSPDLDNPKGIHFHLIDEYAGRSSSLRTPLAEELRNRDFPSNLIISSEHYAQRLSNPPFRDWLYGYLTALGYRLTVIFYIRPQVALINSYYCQRAKALRKRWTPEQLLQWWLSVPVAQNNALIRAPLVADRRMDFQFLPFKRQILKFGFCEDFARHLGVPDATIARCLTVPVANPSPGPKIIAAMRAIYEMAEEPLTAASEAKVAALSSQLRLMMSAKGWNTGKFDGLHPEDKSRLVAAYRPSNETFAAMVWKTSWAEIFADDEDAICANPRNVFEPAMIEPAEREEFEEFCRESAAFVRDFLESQ